jgi:tetratricopeptide (TPR) repeat protein
MIRNSTAPVMRRRLSFVAVALACSALLMADSQAPGTPFVLSHVNVVDVTTGSLQRRFNVIIRDGRIAAVEPAARAAAPAQARVVDATGKFLIPGLADMHVHWYDERYLGLFIANGVTRVRQMWGMPMHLDWRKRIEAGELLGPRFSIASPILDGPNPTYPGSIVVPDAETAAKVVAGIKKDGYDFVKVLSRLPREAYFAIARAARENGLEFVGHVPVAVTAGEAADAGQASIEHLTNILVSSSSAEVRLRELLTQQQLKVGNATHPMSADARAGARELQEKLLATYDDAKAAALFARFAKNHTWQCPTLVGLRAMYSIDDRASTSDPRLKYMPREIRQSLKPGNDPRLAGRSPVDYELDHRVFRKDMDILRAMKKAGVEMLAGTDDPLVGFRLHDELDLLVQAGLTPADALRAATINPARFLHDEAANGSVAAGKNADLVLLDANPLDNIRNTQRIAAVVVRGRYLDRGALDGMLAAVEKTANLLSISRALMPIIQKDGVDAAINAYRDLKAHQVGAYDFSESELNGLGYALLRMKKVDEAVKILELNVEMYPASANTYDSLGEAFMAQGNREKAIANYRKSLELNPNNLNAVEQLKKLGGESAPLRLSLPRCSLMP